MSKRQFALDIYMNKMFKIMMYFMPILAVGAGINFTSFKALGFYETVSWPLLIAFDVTNVIYWCIGIWMGRHSEDKDGNLKMKFVYIGKLLISLIIIIQWNFISYMIPSRDFWAFFVLFIFVSIFFLDSKYVIHTIGIVVISMIISWIIKPNELLPVRNEYFIPELVLRCILIVFVCFLMFIITFIIEKLLIKELENIAEYDSLTLLRNRRTLSMKLDEAIEQFEKSEKPFCFLMGDIDDFKVVNDTYGHPFGDIVLKNIGRDLILNVGQVGHAFRYGGEEICLILFMDFNEAISLANKVREAIAKEVHISGKIKVSVTMSMGLVEYRSKMSKEELIKIADSNLYYAKSHGKNKVVS